MIRLPGRDTDFWELVSGESMHQEYPDTFWMPPLADRQNLKRGQAAKLIFAIESVDEQGEVVETVERMWVIVAERIGDMVIGILDNQPASLVPGEDVYLCFGAEIPFLSEHVIDIGHPPWLYWKWRLLRRPERLWPR